MLNGNQESVAKTFKPLNRLFSSRLIIWLILSLTKKKMMMRPKSKKELFLAEAHEGKDP